MGRSASSAIQTPGVIAADMDDETDNVDATKDTDPAARIATLEAKVAAQAAENKRLRTAKAAEAKLPQVVYEPETPHGKIALEASATRDMTVAGVMAAIKDGTLQEPMNSYLCADGYYVKRA